MEQEDQRLKGTKFLWLYREENLLDKHRPAFEALKAANLKVARAWAMKESRNDVWKYLSTGRARRFVKRWLTWVNKSNLPPHAQSGRVDPETHGKHSDLLPSLKRQRCGRRAEQQDNGGCQEEGLRLKIWSTSRLPSTFSIVD